MATRSWNRVELIGNLTRDPELRYTPTGTAVCTFSIATNRTFITDGERKEEADFHKIVAWNKLGELCNQLLKKGNRVFVSGRLQNRSWEGQDGQNRQTTEIVIEDMILLTSKTGEYSSESSYNAPAPAEAPSRNVDEMPEPVKPASTSERGESVESAESVKSDESAASDTTDQTDSTDKAAPPASEKIDDKELEDLPF